MSRPIKPIYLLYFIVFILALLVLVVATFPRSSLEKLIISEIQSNSPLPMTIESFNFKVPSTLEFNGVTLTTKSQKKVTLDRVKLKTNLLLFIMPGRKKVSFETQLFNGKVDGKIYYLKDEKRVDKFLVNIDSIDSDPLLKLFSIKTKLKIDGKLNGNINVSIPTVNGKKSAAGSYYFHSDKFAIKNFELGGIKFDDDYKDLEAELRGTFSGLVTNIENLSFASKDFGLKINGQMQTPWKLVKGSKLDLTVNLNIYSTKVKLALLKVFLSPQTDGSLEGRILGTISKPRLIKGGS